MLHNHQEKIKDTTKAYSLKTSIDQNITLCYTTNWKMGEINVICVFKSQESNTQLEVHQTLSPYIKN